MWKYLHVHCLIPSVDIPEPPLLQNETFVWLQLGSVSTQQPLQLCWMTYNKLVWPASVQ